MKLLLLNHEYPPCGGGAATATEQIALALGELQHDVHVLTSGFRNEPSEQQVAPRVLVERSLGTRSSRFAPSVWELGQFALAAKRQLNHRVQQIQPDGILAFFAVPAGVLAIDSVKSETPVCVSLRGSDVPGFSDHTSWIARLVGKTTVRRVFRRASKLLPNSDYLADLAIQFDPSVKDKTHVIRNGISSGQIASEPSSSGGDTLRLLQVGQLIDRKRVDWTLRAVKSLHENGTDVHCTIVGDGPARTRLNALADELGIQHSVSWTGFMSRTELYETMRQHDLLVHPSEAEGMSNVVLESMAAGLPVVLAENGSANLIRESGGGAVFEGGHDTLASSVLNAWPIEVRGEQANRAIAYAKQRTWRHVANEFADAVLS